MSTGAPTNATANQPLRIFTLIQRMAVTNVRSSPAARPGMTEKKYV